MKTITITIDKATGKLTIAADGEGACLAARKLGEGLGITEWEDQFTNDINNQQVNDQEVGQ